MKKNVIILSVLLITSILVYILNTKKSDNTPSKLLLKNVEALASVEDDRYIQDKYLTSRISMESHKADSLGYLTIGGKKYGIYPKNSVNVVAIEYVECEGKELHATCDMSKAGTFLSSNQY